MSTAPKLPIERAREVMATWNADGTWREANALNLPGEVDDLADALEALIREHEVLSAAFRDREAWIDPQRVEALAKRHTDANHAAWVEVTFRDTDPDRVPRWRVLVDGDRMTEGATLDEAPRRSEA